MLGASLVGCGGSGEKAALRVVCTNFPLYDWVRELTAGVDGVEILLLADGGKDLHSFEPSVKDMVRISTCDLFVGVGGASEAWLTDYLQTAKDAPKQMLLLSELLADELLEEPKVTRDEQGEDDAHGGHDHDAFDEHLWLSPRLAKMACEGIAAALTSLDRENAEAYVSAWHRYAASLDGLSAMFASAVEGAENKTLVFADRYPFCYLLHDYGLSAYAAFPGCSSESEASFETVAFLSEKVSALGLSHIVAVKGSDLAIAKTVAGAVSGKTPEILIMDSIETVSNKETESYVGRMSLNVEVLKKALGQ